jgi:hypothetical protein
MLTRSCRSCQHVLNDRQGRSFKESSTLSVEMQDSQCGVAPEESGASCTDEPFSI